MRPLRAVFAIFLSFALAGMVACELPEVSGAAEGHAIHRFNTIRDKPPQLTSFLEKMPKGGDLHNHLSGSVFAESYIEWAAADGRCVTPPAYEVSGPPCPDGSIPAADALTDDTLRNAIIDAWSMRNFVPSATRSGHDQFFDSFSRFGGAAAGRAGDMVAEVVRNSRARGLSYLELMVTPNGAPSRALGRATPFLAEDLTATLSALLANPELTAVIQGAVAFTDQMEEGRAAALGCPAEVSSPSTGSGRSPECATTVRYLGQVVRGYSPAEVFSQLVVAFSLSTLDSRWVGLNMVGPEDGYLAMRDYSLHMKMVGFLKTRFPGVKVSLHAGELSPSLVPPQGQTFHIRHAVLTATADRIGHGVDLATEADSSELLEHMSDKPVPVEILFTSNSQILGVEGARHPFTTYRAAGVPTIIATDDAAVSRTTIVTEYQWAVEKYGLNYRDLKQIARWSLEYAFAPGESIWSNPRIFTRQDPCANDDPATEHISQACDQFLRGNQKARLQWNLETEFTRFERSV